MKSKILTLFLLAGATQTFGQTNGIELQLIFTPTFSTRYFSGHSEMFGNSVNDVEKAIISYDAGIMVVPFKTRRLSLGTGAILSRKGFSRLDYTQESWTPVGWELSRIRDIAYFLEIPIRATYNLSSRGQNYLILGVSNDVLLKSKVSEAIVITLDKRKYNVGINLGVGHNFKINDSVVLGVEPNLKFQTMHFLASDIGAKRYLCTVGLALNTKFSNASARTFRR